ncbi:diguanylate cyclase [Cellulomonas sp. NPDC055163]
MTSTPHSSRFGLVPLAERIVWSTCLRVGLLGAVVALWFLTPGARTPPGGAGVWCAAYAVVSAITALASRAGRRIAVLAVNGALLVDGAFLGAAMHALGGVTGPVVGLIVVHVAAVSLLVSFRTGAKVVVWHALVVLCVLSIERLDTGAVAAAPMPFPVRQYTAFVLVSGLAAAATSTFAAINERELRRRRYDAEVLHSLVVGLEVVHEPREIARRLVAVAVEELLGQRALVLLLPAAGTALSPLVETSAAVTTPLAPPESLHAPSLLAGVAPAGGPVLRRAIDPLADPWLTDALPGARGVVCVPIGLDKLGEGWLVVEVARRQSKGVERRMVETLVQACGHVGLALSRATLVEELRRAAQTDGLTGTLNRRAFDDALRRELLRSQRSGAPLAVALVDLDHFKAVNDQHGHVVGDQVLRGAARALRSAARGADLVARYGGEEFAIILPDTTVEQGRDAAERFRRAVAQGDTGVRVSCSIGIAGNEDRPSSEQIVRRADAALYTAKEQGRDRAVAAVARMDQPGTPGDATVLLI